LTDFLCSSANAKKWEVELTTLKNNNARLTSALQESTANVEEWKRQLNSYKEENSRLKVGLIELEAGRGKYYYYYLILLRWDLPGGISWERFHVWEFQGRISWVGFPGFESWFN
jgi:hypothetical protein